MTKTVAQLDAEIAEALGKSTVEVRKVRSADVEERLHHAHGSRNVRTGPAAYGVFLDGVQVANIISERSGYRGRAHWDIITTGYADPRLNHRPLYRGDTLQDVKEWARSHAHVFIDHGQLAKASHAKKLQHTLEQTLRRGRATDSVFAHATGAVSYFSSTEPGSARPIATSERISVTEARTRFNQAPRAKMKCRPDGTCFFIVGTAVGYERIELM